MSAAAPLISVAPSDSARQLARCLDCAARLKGGNSCPGCGRSYPEVGGILRAMGPLEGTNRIAAAFYNGPGWQRFRPWERLFLWFQKGLIGARMQVLRHLPRSATARVLEVGIGDGENLPLLPPAWTVYGVDIAIKCLEACLVRFPALAGKLVLAEGEALPFEDATFDAVFTVGGFNFFRDPSAALREMRRVARPGAPVVVADEIPDLYRFSPARLFGLDELEPWGLRALGLDREFVRMVLEHKVEPRAIARRELPGHRHFPIWSRVGYCLVDPDPGPAWAL
jgi:SAM-dependent methyltransferase